MQRPAGPCHAAAARTSPAFDPSLGDQPRSIQPNSTSSRIVPIAVISSDPAQPMRLEKKNSIRAPAFDRPTLTRVRREGSARLWHRPRAMLVTQARETAMRALIGFALALGVTGEAAAREPIIDMHLHARTANYIGENPPPMCAPFE